MSERNLFHGTPVQAARESRIMHDLAAANIDSVMQVTRMRRDDVGTQGRFLLGAQMLFSASESSVSRILSFCDTSIIVASPSR